MRRLPVLGTQRVHAQTAGTICVGRRMSPSLLLYYLLCCVASLSASSSRKDGHSVTQQQREARAQALFQVCAAHQVQPRSA